MFAGGQACGQGNFILCTGIAISEALQKKKECM
jgi:hypothetical protein